MRAYDRAGRHAHNFHIPHEEICPNQAIASELELRADAARIAGSNFNQRRGNYTPDIDDAMLALTGVDLHEGLRSENTLPNNLTKTVASNLAKKAMGLNYAEGAESVYMVSDRSRLITGASVGILSPLVPQRPEVAGFRVAHVESKHYTMNEVSILAGVRKVIGSGSGPDDFELARRTSVVEIPFGRTMVTKQGEPDMSFYPTLGNDSRGVNFLQGADAVFFPRYEGDVSEFLIKQTDWLFSQIDLVYDLAGRSGGV